MKDDTLSLRDADVLIIVPPFAALEYPSLAAHLLQACGQEAGFQVRVLYANILFASFIGKDAYARICSSTITGAFAGERFFARHAFGLPPLGHHAEKMFAWELISGIDQKQIDLLLDMPANAPWLMDLSEWKCLEAQTAAWLDHLAEAISAREYKIIGCSTTFEQTTASVALLNRIKDLREATVTILGGANCESEMAQGLMTLGTKIDYIFSGESEETFPAFVQHLLDGSPPKDRVIYGKPCENLDALPTPDFSEFYEQRARCLPGSTEAEQKPYILYETSRGCWWGQKHHCTFCGLNGGGMAFRHKSPDRVIGDLHKLLASHPSHQILMTDNIMPHSYFQTLLPRLRNELSGVQIFYEQKANLSLQNVLILQRAGVTSIQPGIEALSSRLLRQMKKGILARQNLMLMRYAKAAGLRLRWNLLWGFPGDELAAYEETLSLVPLLHHLEPPTGFGPLSIDRFSPYFFNPAQFGVNNLRPLPAYFDFLPDTADVQRIAYHFTGEYQSAAFDHIELIYKLSLEVRRWRSAWQSESGRPPELKVCRYRKWYVLVDSRGLPETEKAHVLDREDTAFLLTARPYTASEQEIWALQQKLAIIADDWFIPLAVADPEMLLEFETEQTTLRHSPKLESELHPS